MKSPHLLVILPIALCILFPTVSTSQTFPKQAWQTSTPEEQGLDSEALDLATEYLQQHSGKDGVGEVVMIRNGYLVWKGDKANKKHGVWSMTKSFTSTCLGLLIDDGKCTLDTLACEYVPSMRKDYPNVTLRHFTTMTSGYRAEGDEPRGGYSHGPSVTPFIPSSNILFKPGTAYAYWDSAMNQFANVLTKIAGEPLDELFHRRIAQPIGIHPEDWKWGDFGKVDGLKVVSGSGNHSRLEIHSLAVARLGLLFLNKGHWDGQQLISENWVNQATSVQVPASLPPGSDKAAAEGWGRYGFNWWVNGVDENGKRKWPDVPVNTYSASGYNNNDLFVIPGWNMVVVRLGLDQRDVAIGDKVYNEFLKLIGASILSTTQH